jgi:hypothetical protein
MDAKRKRGLTLGAQEMDQAYRQEMAQQRIDRVPKAQVAAPVEEDKTEPLVPLPVTATSQGADAGKQEQK